ncbi:MAG: MFS transporter [Burkholderiales bacterium]
MFRPEAHPWLAALAVYRHPRVLAILFLGFSAGLPPLLAVGTLSRWLAEAGVDRAQIGYFSWVGLVWGLKFLWSPLVDRLPLPLLGRWLGKRRAWLLLGQLAAAVGLVGLAHSDPAQALSATLLFALLVAVGSATQDIALDAWRIEAVSLERQAAMAASYQTGYRIAMIIAGAGVLWIAALFDPSETHYEFFPWRVAYSVMAGLMGVGVATTLLIGEPEHPAPPPAIAREGFGRWLYGSFVSPVAEFFARYRWQALVILGLIALYRISDVVMGVMSNPFYWEMGFTKEEVATVSKVYGVIMSLAGAGLGGLLVARLGLMRTLFLGALLSAATNLLFLWLLARGHDVWVLMFTVSADNLSAGIASSAFVAYLSGLVNQAYSATQYALFSSLMLLLPKLIAGFSGEFVNVFGWSAFFTGTALLGLPVLVLVWRAARAGPHA